MTGQAASPFPGPRRILVRGVNWLGDAVMTTPALLRLRERFADAHIALLTPAALGELWTHHPAVNEVLTFPSRSQLLPVSRRLRAGRFDLALVLPNSPRAALEVWLAGIPQRVGYARPWRSYFLTRAVPLRAGGIEMRPRSVSEIKRRVAAAPPVAATVAEPSGPAPGATWCASPGAHHIHHYLHLAAALGANPTPVAPQVVVRDEEVDAAARKFGLCDEAERGFPLLGLCPGAQYGPAKRWPAEDFIAAAERVQLRVRCRWLVFGGPGETALAEQVAAEIAYEAERPPTAGRLPPNRSARNLAGQTSLRELCALLKLCRVVLTNDTGPMHVAAALGTPVVVPFGSTRPELTGPGLPGDPRHALLQADVPCAPCFRRTCPIDFRCMHGISVERVAEAVLAALRR